MARKGELPASRRAADVALSVHRNNSVGSPETACRELAAEGGIWSGVQRMSSGSSKERRAGSEVPVLSYRRQVPGIPLQADCSDCGGGVLDCTGRPPSSERALFAERAAVAERASAERAQSTCRSCLAADRAAGFAEQVAAAERRVVAAEQRAIVAEQAMRALELERASGASAEQAALWKQTLALEQAERESVESELHQIRLEREQLRRSLAKSSEENQDLRQECNDAARRLEEQAAELEGARASAETSDAVAQGLEHQLLELREAGRADLRERRASEIRTEGLTRDHAREIADLRAAHKLDQARFESEFREQVEAVQAECREQLQASLNSRQRELEKQVQQQVQAGTEKEVRRLRETVQEQKRVLSELESELRQERNSACSRPGDYMRMVKQKEGEGFSCDNAQHVLRFQQLEYTLQAYSRHLPPTVLAQARKEFEALCACGGTPRTQEEPETSP